MQNFSKNIWLDGKLIPYNDAKIHILSHCIHYGSGVFEGIKCYKTPDGPAVFRLKDHIERLHYSANAFKMKIPFSVDELFNATIELIKANSIQDCYLRPLVFYGYDTLGVHPKNCPVQVAIATLDWGAYISKEALAKGARITISPWKKFQFNAFPKSVKATGQYLNSMLAVQDAKSRGYDEALLLNYDNTIAEGSGQNIFIIKNNVFHTNDLNSIKELFSDRYDNFKLYENPVALEFDGMEIALLPWINNENYKNSMDFVNSTSAQWLIGHLELDGYEVLRGIKYDGGMSPKNFSRFEQVLSGHFHCKQEKGNIIYLGAPYQITFSDVNEPKGFWILDTDTRELEFIKNDQKLFYTLSYDDIKYDYSKFISENHPKYRDTYVKIYVINKEKPYILDRVIDSLYNSGVYDLSIVEDVDNTITNSIDSQKVDITKSTLELIYEEVDNLEDIKDSNTVKQLIKELYMESLTV